jgi:hypothetical protein
VYLKIFFGGIAPGPPGQGGKGRGGKGGEGGHKGKEEKGGREGRERRGRGYGCGGKGLGPPMFDTDRRPWLFKMMMLYLITRLQSITFGCCW